MLHIQDNYICLRSQEEYYDFSAGQATPSVYIHWKPREEASDEEIMAYAAKSRTFAFLSKPEEDIYSCDDGKPL